ASGLPAAYDVSLVAEGTGVTASGAHLVAGVANRPAIVTQDCVANLSVKSANRTARLISNPVGSRGLHMRVLNTNLTGGLIAAQFITTGCPAVGTETWMTFAGNVVHDDTIGLFATNSFLFNAQGTGARTHVVAHDNYFFGNGIPGTGNSALH